MSTTTFSEMWAPTWELVKSIPGAKCCVVENTNRTFKSGRRVVEAIFFDENRQVVARRDAMRLVSKKGNEYVVCRREAEADHHGDLAELLDE